MKHEPMSQERLAEARAALDEDMSQWGGEYGLELIAEVERLRARLTVDEDMVERAARVLNEEGETPGTLSWDNESEMNRRSYRRMARAALDAALGTGEGS